MLVDADARARDEPGDVLAQLAEGAADGRRVEHCSAARDRRFHLGVGRMAGTPADEQRLGHAPPRVAASREGLADARVAEAEADVAVLVYGVGELGEAPVLLRGDERARP